MFQTFEGLLDTGDEYTQAALAYARRMITDKVTNLGAGMDSGKAYGIVAMVQVLLVQKKVEIIMKMVKIFTTTSVIGDMLVKVTTVK